MKFSCLIYRTPLKTVSKKSHRKGGLAVAVLRSLCRSSYLTRTERETKLGASLGRALALFRGSSFAKQGS